MSDRTHTVTLAAATLLMGRHADEDNGAAAVALAQRLYDLASAPTWGPDMTPDQMRDLRKRMVDEVVRTKHAHATRVEQLATIDAFLAKSK